MPEKKTGERAAEDKAEGKSPSTQAGEFVREEIEHIREGKHGARSAKQAIAIGLSKARRAGVKLPAPKKGKASKQTRKQAARPKLDLAKFVHCVLPLEPGTAVRLRIPSTISLFTRRFRRRNIRISRITDTVESSDAIAIGRSLG
jgi:hypothetical protein